MSEPFTHGAAGAGGDGGGHTGRHALGRSLRAATIGAPMAMESRERELYDLRADDMSQNVHAPFGGVAFRRPVWTSLAVGFPNAFLQLVDPSGGGDRSVDEPTFTYGVKLQSGPDVMVTVVLRSWITDDRDFITGASLRVSALLPEARKRTHFNGVLHLQFTGYAAATEDDSEG